MRLWSLHPKHLDRIGLIALWRESLLAKKVLENKTKGYKNHPQLIRFKKNQPLKRINNYLYYVYKEAINRGYNFDKTKFKYYDGLEKSPLNDGQLKYEKQHLKNKILVRSPDQVYRLKGLDCNPIFYVKPGLIESWEVLKT